MPAAGRCSASSTAACKSASRNLASSSAAADREQNHLTVLAKGKAMAQRPDIRLTPDEQTAFLRENRKAALATLDQDGFPHVVAMNFIIRDGAYYMTSYGKAQKVVNIRRNPKVGVMVETGG